MSDDNGHVEWYRRHRPKVFKHVHGQDEAVTGLKDLLRNGFPHALLLSGPSGVGKTTLARIMKTKLQCDDADWADLNAASARGIDTVREIEASCRMRPMVGDSRIWLVDECHRLTQDSQSALLKILEDPPSHTYFFFATTEPQKLLRTVVTRCTEVRLKPLTHDALVRTLKRVAGLEGVESDAALLDAVAAACGGSARQAVTLLQRTQSMGPEEAVDFVLGQQAEGSPAASLAQVLTDPKTSKAQKWDAARKLLKAEGLDPEEVRWGVLGYARAVLLNSPGGKRADYCYNLICAFESNFYDSKHAGLARAVYEFLGK